jgi:hypothetical protein
MKFAVTFQRAADYLPLHGASIHVTDKICGWRTYGARFFWLFFPSPYGLG